MLFDAVFSYYHCPCCRLWLTKKDAEILADDIKETPKTIDFQGIGAAIEFIEKNYHGKRLFEERGEIICKLTELENYEIKK